MKNIGGYNRIYPICPDDNKKETEKISPRLAQIYKDTSKKDNKIPAPIPICARPSLFPDHISKKASLYYARFN